MGLYLIAYDLRKTGQNYECLNKKLQAMDAYWHFQQSVWLASWDGSAHSLATHLNTCLDANDLLFVTRVTEDAAWVGYNDAGTDWIQRHI